MNFFRKDLSEDFSKIIDEDVELFKKLVQENIKKNGGFHVSANEYFKFLCDYFSGAYERDKKNQQTIKDTISTFEKNVEDWVISPCSLTASLWIREKRGGNEIRVSLINTCSGACYSGDEIKDATGSKFELLKKYYIVNKKTKETGKITVVVCESGEKYSYIKEAAERSYKNFPYPDVIEKFIGEKLGGKNLEFRLVGKDYGGDACYLTKIATLYPERDNIGVRTNSELICEAVDKDTNQKALIKTKWKIIHNVDECPRLEDVVVLLPFANRDFIYGEDEYYSSGNIEYIGNSVAIPTFNKDTKKMGIFKNGRMLINEIYDNITYEGGHFITENDGKFGVYGVTEPKYDNITYEGGHFITENDGKFGVYGVTEPKYDKISYNKDGHFLLAEKNGKYGIPGIIEPQYDKIERAIDNNEQWAYITEKDGKRGIRCHYMTKNYFTPRWEDPDEVILWHDHENKYVIPCVFDDIEPISIKKGACVSNNLKNKVFLVKVDGYYGVYSHKIGDFLVSPAFKERIFAVNDECSKFVSFDHEKKVEYIIYDDDYVESKIIEPDLTVKDIYQSNSGKQLADMSNLIKEVTKYKKKNVNKKSDYDEYQDYYEDDEAISGDSVRKIKSPYDDLDSVSLDDGLPF